MLHLLYTLIVSHSFTLFQMSFPDIVWKEAFLDGQSHPCSRNVCRNHVIYFQLRLTWSCSHATSTLYSNDIPICINVCESSLFAMVSKAFLNSTKHQYSVSIITPSVTKWSIVECSGLKPTWPSVCLWLCSIHEVIFYSMIALYSLTIIELTMIVRF